MNNSLLIGDRMVNYPAMKQKVQWNTYTIDLVCRQLENDEDVSRWKVLGRQNIIIEKLKARGTWTQAIEDRIWELVYSARESL